MTKERFVYLINFIEEHRKLECSLCDILENMTDGCYVDAFIYSKYENELVKTLKDALAIPEENEDIEYFMYDLEFGKSWKPGMVEVDGKDIDLSSAEKLYDYLIQK